MTDASPLVSLMGPLAVGKTTLATALAGRLGARLVLEDWASNPFLAASFTGDASARLPGQLYFLLTRVAQLALSTWPREAMTVTDYGFCQDPIYAALELSGAELAAYEAVRAAVAGRVKQPDVLVSLDAPVDVLLERIKCRGREFEMAIGQEFLTAMRAAHAAAAAEARRAGWAVVEVDTSQQDIRDAAVQGQLSQEVQRWLR